MSYIENYRIGGEKHHREMWDKHDISEYCGINIEKADRLLKLANEATGGYWLR